MLEINAKDGISKEKAKVNSERTKDIGEQLKAKQSSCITTLVSLFHAPLNSDSGPTLRMLDGVTIVRGVVIITGEGGGGGRHFNSVS